MTLFFLVRDWEHTLLRSEFDRQATSYSTAMQGGVNRSLEVLESIAALYAASDLVQRDEFHAFVTGALSRHNELQALEWIPRVMLNQRKRFEESARQDGFADFRISERKVQGEMVEALQRLEYYPAYFIEPLKGNEAAFGFDLASNAIRKKALEHARDAGKMVATEPITLVQEKASQQGLLIFYPIYRKGKDIKTVSSRRNNLTGYILGVFRIGDMIDTALNIIDNRELDIVLKDQEASIENNFIYFNKIGPDQTLSREFTWSGIVSLPERNWSLQLSATPQFLDRFAIWQPWGVLFGGFLVVLLLTFHMFNRIRRSARIKRLVLAREWAEQEMKLSARVLENTPEGVMITGLDLRIISVNPAFVQTTGYSKDEAIGQLPSLLKSGRHDKSFYQDMWQALLESRQWQGEIWNRRKNGDIYPEWLNITSIYDDDGRVINYAGIFSDLSAQEHVRKRIHNLAYYDALTGLPNRELFQDRLNNILAQRIQNNRIVALMFLDLDRFKAINDTLGHKMGDKLIKSTAKRLKQCVRKGDTIARLGGDEFTVIITGLSQLEEAAQVAKKIIKSFSLPFHIDGQNLFISTSIGIGVFPINGKSAETLIKNAEIAMYRSKEEGGNSYHFYEAEMSKHFIKNLVLENDLRIAVEQNELELVFQLKSNLISGKSLALKHYYAGNTPSLVGFHQQCLSLSQKRAD